MKPVKLELKGFTSFREKTSLDFSGLDLFAITGPTGAGKTSLLDAMTYALYGKTPRLGKAAAELISQGEPALNVSLEFRAGPELYRVTRTLDEDAQSARGREEEQRKLAEGFAEEVRDRAVRLDVLNGQRLFERLGFRTSSGATMAVAPAGREAPAPVRGAEK